MALKPITAYALNTQSYSSGGEALGVKSYSHEVSAALYVRMPMGKFRPFALAGVGALIFDPKDFAGAKFTVPGRLRLRRRRRFRRVAAHFHASRISGLRVQFTDV